MAAPVEFRRFTPINSREDLLTRLENAPEDHVEALLAAYEVLERLHEAGALDLINGLLSAKNKIIEELSDGASSQPIIHLMRLGLIMGQLLSQINPDDLHALVENRSEKPPSLLKIASQATTEEARRGMAFGVALLNLLGGSLKPEAQKKTQAQ